MDGSDGLKEVTQTRTPRVASRTALRPILFPSTFRILERQTQRATEGEKAKRQGLLCLKAEVWSKERGVGPLQWI